MTGDPNAWFNPAAFALPAAGTFGNTGRGDFIGPNLRTVDLSLVKNAALSALGLGATAATAIAPLVRILGFALAALAACVLVHGEWRRRARTPKAHGAEGCCAARTSR